MPTTLLEVIQRGLAGVGAWLDRILFAICAVLLMVIFFSVFTGVIIRYVVNVPWPWTEEVARFSLIWFAPLAAAICARKGIHFSFQWGVMPLSDGSRAIVRQVTNIIIVVFLVMLLKLSVDFLNVVENQTAMATEVSMLVPAFGIVLGVGMLLTIYTLEIVDAALGLLTGRQFSIKELQEQENIKVLQSGMQRS